MKTKSIKTAVVTESPAIESLFKRNSLGYLEVTRKAVVSMDDAVGYVVNKLENGQSAVRDAILFAGWIFKNQPEAESKAFGESLKERWNGSTIPNLLSIAKALPSFEEKGLSVDKVRDLYGLREVSKLLKGDESKEAIALLNKGESPRAVKEKLSPKRESVQSDASEEKEEEAVNFKEESDKLESLLLSYADKLSSVAEHEQRLKVARHVIAKLKLGAYVLLHAEAASAVKKLKEAK